MRRAILIPLVGAAIVLSATAGVAVASAIAAQTESSSVTTIDPLVVTPSPGAPGATDTPTPSVTPDAPVAVTPHESEDVGDDHGGRGHGGGDDADDNDGDDDSSGRGSGRGGGDDD